LRNDRRDPGAQSAGLRTMKREPYHAETDPNRLWPEIKPRQPDPDKRPPSSLELAFKRIFEAMTASADFMIDYHCAWTDSISFVFRDRVMYVEDKAVAEALAARQDEMIRAYGHTVITEFPVEKYIDEKLHRSTSGAALLVSHIPSFTVELGTGDMPDPRIIRASVAGTRNVLRWAGMLDGDREPITGIKVVEPGFRVRRMMTPRVSEE
jgi:predicted deacylase